ncbi:MAG: Sec-independent protein translocase subunit TatA [Dermatophilaceae bacterium]
MGIRGLFEGWHLVVLIVLVVVIFGWKRLPDAARSLGRSMRIFKSEVDGMKSDGKSASSTDTVNGNTVDPQAHPDQAGAQQPHSGETR